MENNSVYIEQDDGWATPCCGIGMWGDIIENETLCPYCEKTFKFEDDQDTNENTKCQTCGGPGEEKHACPYALEISGDDTECNCCDGCRNECSMAI